MPKWEDRVKQKWMTSDILQKMERRRLAKSNVDEYNKLDAIWHEYISELYDDNRGDIPQVHTENELTPVTRTEVEIALKGMPLNKAPGPDNIFTKCLLHQGKPD